MGHRAADNNDSGWDAQGRARFPGGLSAAGLPEVEAKAKFLHCVRTACILRTQRLGYSPKNTCHLSSSTAKQQSPHENNENAFKGAKQPRAELRIYTCIGSSMCNCTMPFVFWELILASILKAFKHDFLQCFPSLVLRGAP